MFKFLNPFKKNEEQSPLEMWRHISVIHEENKVGEIIKTNLFLDGVSVTEIQLKKITRIIIKNGNEIWIKEKD